MRRIAGIDGCKSGWVVVSAYEDLSDIEIRLYEKFLDVFEQGLPPQLVAVDMPMGFAEKAETGGRVCERELRKILGREKGSSVFPSPCRAALQYDMRDQYAEACRVNRENSIDKAKSITIFCHGIFKKINELDKFVRENTNRRIFECHPEYTFALMRNPMAPKPIIESKKSAAGLAIRAAVLTKAGIDLSTNWRSLFRRKDAALDDVLDAAACLWSASRILTGEHKRLPADGELRDSKGILMAIHA
jgi:predicted RNase H-like nuclease